MIVPRLFTSHNVFVQASFKLEFSLVLFRRIHISRSTLDCLGGIYEAEAGHGQERSEFLRKHNIDTYLIRPAPREEAEPPKLRRPSYDDMTTWSAELPFGDILGMNFVRAISDKPMVSAAT